MTNIYDTIRDGALKWSQRWLGHVGERVMLYLFLFPDLVRLMINLVSDNRVFLFDKLFVVGVLIYIISPIDFFPEILTGPFGLIEDFILAVFVLFRFLSNPYNTPAIRDHWKGDPNVIIKLQQWSQYLKMLMQKRR